MQAAFAAANSGRLEDLTAVLDCNPAALNLPHVGGIYDSRSLLMTAAARGHQPIVVELLRRGADAALCDKRGSTAASLARKQGHETIAALLDNHSQPPVLRDGPQPTPQMDAGKRPAAGRAAEDASTSGKRQRTEVATFAASRNGAPDLDQAFQLALNGNVAGLSAILDRDSSVVNLPQVRGIPRPGP